MHEKGERLGQMIRVRGSCKTPCEVVPDGLLRRAFTPVGYSENLVQAFGRLDLYEVAQPGNHPPVPQDRQYK